MKKIASLLLALIIVVPAVLFGLLFLVLSKPEYYQEELQAVFLSETGLNLELQKIGWRYWPPIALTIENVHIENPETRDVVAELGYAAVDLDLLSLVFGNSGMQVKGFEVDNLRLNLIVDSYGNKNWVRIKPPPSEGSQSSASDDDGILGLLPFGVRELEISNTIVHYEDKGSGEKSNLSIRNFSTDSVGYDQPFMLNMDMSVEDIKNLMEASLDGSLSVLVDSSTDQVNVSNIQLDGLFNKQGISPLPLEISGSLIFSMIQDQLETRDLAFGLGDIRITNNLILKDVLKNPSGIKGSIRTTSFNPKKLMKVTGLADLEFTNPQVFSKMQLTVDIDSDFTRFEAKNIEITLDDSSIKGTVRARLIERPEFIITMDADRINLAHYIPVQEAVLLEDLNEEKTDFEDSVLIPRDIVQSYTINAHLYSKDFMWDDIAMQDIKLHLSTAGNTMKSSLKGKIYGGNFDFEFADIPDDADSSGYSRLNLDNVDIKALTGFDWITGSLFLSSSLEFSGHMLGEVLNTITGPANFRIKKGSIDISPVKSIAGVVDNLRGAESGIAEWPDKLSFQEMEGHHRFNGNQRNQSFDMTVDNLRIEGTGGFVYQENTMDYEVAAMVRESNHGQIKVSPELTGVRWPMKCKGRMDESPLGICKPHTKAIEDYLKNTARQKIKDSARDKLQEKARNALKGLFN